MAKWLSILFGIGLITLGCIAFFDMIGFDTMGRICAADPTLTYR